MDRSQAGLVRRDRLDRAAGRRPRADVRRSRERSADNVGIWSAADVVDVLVNIGVPILGIVIVNKRPRNAIGWVFIVAGAALALASFGQAYALHVLVADPGTLPAGRALAWLSNVLWPIPIVCLTLLFLLFPTGHLPSPRWRPVVWLVGVILVLLTIASLILATAGWSDPFEGINVAAGSAGDVARVGDRDRRARGDRRAGVGGRVARRCATGAPSGVERLQLKWFVSAAAVAAVAFSVGFFFDSAVVSAIVSVSLLFLYVAIGIAMVKHNLYDIDVIINKTITYGALAAFITAIYVVVVVVIGAVIGVTEGVSLVATAIVAVAFQPIRRRAQQIANRLVYGERATPYEVLSRFSEHVGETYSGEDILVRMARLLAEGTGATSAVVWLRVGDEVRPAATWPTNGGDGHRDPSRTRRAARGRGRDRAVPVRHQRELLGLLTVTKPPNEALSPVEEKLVADLAGAGRARARELQADRGSPRLAPAAGRGTGRGTTTPRAEPARRGAAAARRPGRPAEARPHRPRRRTSWRRIGCSSSSRAT